MTTRYFAVVSIWQPQRVPLGQAPAFRGGWVAAAALWVWGLGLVLLATAGSCSGKAGGSGKKGEGEPGTGTQQTGESSAEAQAREEAERRAFIEKEFPLHGLVTGVQLKVLEGPQPEATLLGWLRIGSRIRLAPGKKKSRTCSTGWYRLYPRGWACAGQGIRVAKQPPGSVLAVAPAPKDAALPYQYYFVKDELAPEYHRLPTRDEQRAAADFAARFREIRENNELRAERFWNGELPNEMTKPAVVQKYLNRGFFVAGAGIEKRAARNFVRTVRGRYVKLAQLEKRRGSAFSGVELDEQRTLPVAWAVRSGPPFMPKQREDGSLRLVPVPDKPPVERHSIVPWAGRQRIGERLFHRLEDGTYLKHWFLAVAEKVPPPKGVGEDEPWIHVDLGQQTMVLYRGATPVYATLVSSGLEGHDTPVGTFTVMAKYVADTMSDLGPDAGDERYKIEDVPWTQYFKGSVALHGAFWHERFGLRRSHGCINLAPLDAHRAFDHTRPHVPEGWHGVSTDRTGFEGSTILITE